MRNALFVLAFVLMLAGPLLQGLTGGDNPNAYVFAPVMLAGLIPVLAGRNLSPEPRLMAAALLVCGALCLGAWYLGGLLPPRPLPPALPVGCAILGAVVATGANLLRRRQG